MARGAHFIWPASPTRSTCAARRTLPLIQGELAEALGSQAQIIYLQADICRADLLVEIEATAICPLTAAA